MNRSLRDLETSFKPKGNPFRLPSATPPRSPSDLARVTRSPSGGAPEPRVVEKAVTELIEKDKAREGDVQRMLEMVAALQGEMADLKRENEQRAKDPPPETSREDSKAAPPPPAAASPPASPADGEAPRRGFWSR